MYECMYVCMYICMYVCMYACVHACMHVRIQLSPRSHLEAFRRSCPRLVISMALLVKWYEICCLPNTSRAASPLCSKVLSQQKSVSFGIGQLCTCWMAYCNHSAPLCTVHNVMNEPWDTRELEDPKAPVRNPHTGPMSDLHPHGGL